MFRTCLIGPAGRRPTGRVETNQSILLRRLTMRHFLFFYLLKRFAVPAGLPLILFANSALAATATPKYIQGNYAVPQTIRRLSTVPYAAAQTAGNLNVVIVGWSDSTAQSVR